MTTNSNMAHSTVSLPRQLEITENTQNGVTVLRLDGDLNIKSLEEVRRAFRELLDPSKEGTPRIVMDLDGVEYMDSSGLGFIIGSLKTVREARGDLKLANLNAYLLGIFKLINLHYIIDCYDDLDKAVASFLGP